LSTATDQKPQKNHKKALLTTLTLTFIQIKLGMEAGLGAGHIVLDEDPAFPPSKEHSPQLSAHVCCGQPAGWIKMPLGREVGLGPGDIVLDGDPSPFPQKGAQPPIFDPCLLWLNGYMDHSATWCGGRPPPRPQCVRCGPSSPQRGTAPQFSAYVCCSQTAGWIKMPLGTELGLGAGDIVLDGGSTQLPLKWGAAPTFGPMSIVAKRSSISATAEHL